MQRRRHEACCPHPPASTRSTHSLQALLPPFGLKTQKRTHTHCIYQALQLCHSCWILEQGLVFSSMWPPVGREQFFYRVVAYFCLTLYLLWAHLWFNSGGCFLAILFSLIMIGDIFINALFVLLTPRYIHTSPLLDENTSWSWAVFLSHWFYWLMICCRQGDV